MPSGVGAILCFFLKRFHDPGTQTQTGTDRNPKRLPIRAACLPVFFTCLSFSPYRLLYPSLGMGDPFCFVRFHSHFGYPNLFR